MSGQDICFRMISSRRSDTKKCPRHLNFGVAGVARFRATARALPYKPNTPLPHTLPVRLQRQPHSKTGRHTRRVPLETPLTARQAPSFVNTAARGSILRSATEFRWHFFCPCRYCHSYLSNQLLVPREDQPGESSANLDSLHCLDIRRVGSVSAGASTSTNACDPSHDVTLPSISVSAGIRLPGAAAHLFVRLVRGSAAASLVTALWILPQLHRMVDQIAVSVCSHCCEGLFGSRFTPRRPQDRLRSHAYDPCCYVFMKSL